MKNWLRRPIYAVLFAVFPVIALLASNIQEIRIWTFAIPFIAVVVTAGVVILVLTVLMKDVDRAGFITALLFLSFFTYGHFYKFLEDVSIFGLSIGRHRFLIPLYCLILAFSFWWISQRKVKFSELNYHVNIVALIAVTLPILQMAGFWIRSYQSNASPPQDFLPLKNAPTIETQVPPDVYYIILDSYSRGDALKSDFQLDNQQFLHQLNEMGFYVADCAMSNYGTTRFSLSSSLNMNYLPVMAPELTADTGTPKFVTLIKHGIIRQLFEKAGYQIVAFETGYTWTEWYDADQYLTPGSSNLFLNQLKPLINLFSRTTALKIIYDSKGFTHKFPYDERVNQVFFALEQLRTLPSIPGPKFVFAHIPVPHSPYIFAPDGSILTDPGYWSKDGDPINQDYYKKGYSSQVEFISRSILPILQEIISSSKVPPMIILQGDHGMTGKHRLAILNAYYVPPLLNDQLYRAISPVNSFRLISNYLWGTDLPLLKDAGYMVEEGELIPYPENLPSCAGK